MRRSVRRQRTRHDRRTRPPVERPRRLPIRPVTIAAQSYLKPSGLTVRVPAHISPDLYFIGFLVTPVPTGPANLTSSTRSAPTSPSMFPGPRTKACGHSRRVGRCARLPDQGTLHIRNVGHAAARYWGENDTTSSPDGGIPQQHRIDKSLLPIGRATIAHDHGQACVAGWLRDNESPDRLFRRHRDRDKRNRRDQTRPRYQPHRPRGLHHPDQPRASAWWRHRRRKRRSREHPPNDRPGSGSNSKGPKPSLTAANSTATTITDTTLPSTDHPQYRVTNRSSHNTSPRPHRTRRLLISN